MHFLQRVCVGLLLLFAVTVVADAPPPGARTPGHIWQASALSPTLPQFTTDPDGACAATIAYQNEKDAYNASIMTPPPCAPPHTDYEGLMTVDASTIACHVHWLSGFAVDTYTGVPKGVCAPGGEADGGGPEYNQALFCPVGMHFIGVQSAAQLGDGSWASVTPWSTAGAYCVPNDPYNPIQPDKNDIPPDCASCFANKHADGQ